MASLAALNATKAGDLGRVSQILSTHPSAAATKDANGLSLLHWASTGNGGHDLVTTLLQYPVVRAYVSLPSRAGVTPLHLAAASKHPHSHLIVDALIAAGADVNARNSDGRTPLHAAAFAGASHVVARLIAAGADVRVRDADGASPMDCALRGGVKQRDALAAALGRELTDADTSRRNVLGADAGSPEFRLWSAAQVGALDVVRSLVEVEHVDCGVADADGVTAMHFAASGGHVDVLDYLLGHHATVNCVSHAGVVPLHLAAAAGHLPATRLLLDASVGSAEYAKNAPDNLGRTPLHMAAWEGHFDVVAALLDADVRIDIATHRGNSVLHMAAAPSPTKPKAALVQLLLDAGLLADVPNLAGQTPADLAALEAESISLLLAPESGAVRLGSSVGTSSALDAARAGDTLAFKTCLASAPTANDRTLALAAVDAAGFTALHWAAYFGHTDIVTEALAHGASTAARAHDGRTALSLAAAEGRTQVVDLLLQAGASVSDADNDGRTPLHAATAHLHVPSVAALMAAGANPSTTDRTLATPLSYLHSRVSAMLKLLAPKLEGSGAVALRAAVDAGELATFVALLDAGVSPNVRAPDGSAPIHWVVTARMAAPSLTHRAAAAGMLDALLAQDGVAVDAPDNARWTALMWAAGGGLDSFVHSLLAAGAFPDAVNSDGRTALHLAVFESQTRAVAALLDAGASPNTRDALGNTPDQYAKRPDVQALLSRSQVSYTAAAAAADAAPTDEIHAALRRAAAEGRADVVKRALDTNGLGADPNAPDEEGVTALHWAAEMGHANVAALLLAHPAIAPNATTAHGATPLHWAVDGGARDVVLALLAQPAIEVSPRLASTGATPLHAAVRAGMEAISTDLVRAGADVAARDSQGDTPLHAAVELGSVPLVRLLLEAGAPATAAGHGGLTPLHLAVGRNRDAIVAMLLSGGRICERDINASDETGATPLHYALVGLLAGRNNEDEIEVLLSLGADVHARCDAPPGVGTALHFAALDNHVPIASALLGLGADVNARNMHGLTPLHYVADNGHLEMAAVLLASGADIHAPSNTGESPLEWAADNAHLHALLSSGSPPVPASTLSSMTPASSSSAAASSSSSSSPSSSSPPPTASSSSHGFSLAVSSTSSCTPLRPRHRRLRRRRRVRRRKPATVPSFSYED
ncbi:uncharacterized protein AMSG_02926 [Thecamonas trahens ATCC 50062]|uniref:Uncharacterized protein n=1 Tax=Thecamonas trahens ATCC 50062 TaxID=461836 RepID=A0A0L0D2R1_THETB|nr:hypothetical protein AMSG_02926 [Thecamonas trahens ATCC 50062]KNC46491.1 hypothetical protein AMSG_02926 [Thecamonas trahens ATCC 50062]|eukprot:XP_013760272.1 hypothetical protein AMSG_02926 [Thecamonas trahens ATCC 50062]